MAENTNTERELYNACHAYINAHARMETAMADGYNVHGAISGLIGAEDNLRASLSLPAAGQEPVAKLWLWKNFVNGRPEYWAFDNPFPCVSVGGDPLTFGEPCGWALLKPSVNGRPDRSEQEVTNTVVRLAAAPQPAAPYSIDADPQGIRATVADAITGALAFGAQGVNKPPEGHWLAPFWNAARADKIAPQPAVAAGWMPIETAPKDGRFLVRDGTWHGEVAASSKLSDVALVERESGGAFAVADTDYYSAYIVDPTGWQPLPPAPSTEGERNG